MNNSSPDWHNRIKILLTNRIFITVELLLAVTLQILQASHVISAAVVYLFIIGWLSLWLRKSGWRQIGTNPPPKWFRTIGIAVVVGVLYQTISVWLIVPLLHHLTHEPLDLSQFASLHHNASLLILWLAVSWSIAAFGEEMVYRGYLLNRAADIFSRNRVGWCIAWLVSSGLFGLGHAYQGMTGILETFLFGFVMIGLYFLEKRNLWLPIIAHGVYDTAGFILIFLGLYH